MDEPKRLTPPAREIEIPPFEEEFENRWERHNQGEFYEGEEQSLLSHFHARLSDSLRPAMREQWKEASFSTPHGKRILVRSKWILNGLDIIGPWGVARNVDCTAFVWYRDFISGAMGWDTQQARRAVSTFKQIHLKVLGYSCEHIAVQGDLEEKPASDVAIASSNPVPGRKWAKLNEILLSLPGLPSTKEQRESIRSDYNSRFGNKSDGKGRKWPTANEKQMDDAIKYLKKLARPCS